MEIKLAKRAIATPLVGLVIAWVLFMFALYSELFIHPIYDDMGNYLGEAEVVRASTYLFLSAIVAFGLLALWGQRLALHSRELAGPDNPLARAAHRFSNLTVILSLAVGAVYAIGNFLSAFNRYGNREENLLIRIFDVYVPILLATALVVFIILRAFVFRKKTIKGQKKEGLSETEKALGLGYALPILFTAAAIIFGLVVYDVTRTDLQVWVWVVIQVIIALGILLGTRFAAKAKVAKAEAPKTRQTLAAGASNLNFVLSIVYGAVVSVMAFSFGSEAIDKLRIWPEYDSNGKPINGVYTWGVAPFDLKWFVEEMVPALVLLFLAVAGIYLFITERNKVALAVPPKPAATAAKKSAGKAASKPKAVATSKPSASKKPAPKKKSS